MSSDLVEITLLSLAVSGAATLISLLIGLPIGTWLALSRFRSRRLALSVVNTGMALPPVVAGLFIAILLWRSGILGGLGLMYTPGAMVIAEVVIAVPVVAGLSAAGLGQLDPRLQLQLQGLGASRWQTVWWLWREARLALGAAMMVGGNIAHETRVLTTAIVLETGRGELGNALVLGLVLLALAFMVNGVLTWAQQREPRR
jgi:tungstate transport system permease protein